MEANKIQIKEHFLDKSQYLVGSGKKDWIFLHHTAGWDNPFQTIDGWNKDTRGKIATEFVLGGQNIKKDLHEYDGVIAQAFPKGNYGWHLGTGNSLMHRNSVGIEICSFGQVVKGLNYVNIPVPENQIVKLAKPFRGYQYWHKYSDKQITSLKELILFISNRDSIDAKKGLVELIKLKGVDAFDVLSIPMCQKQVGMWTHTNVLRGKVDCSPQPNLIDMLLSL